MLSEAPHTYFHSQAAAGYTSEPAGLRRRGRRDQPLQQGRKLQLGRGAPGLTCHPCIPESELKIPCAPNSSRPCLLSGRSACAHQQKHHLSTRQDANCFHECMLGSCVCRHVCACCLCMYVWCSQTHLACTQVFQYYHHVNAYRAIEVLSGVATLLCGPFCAFRHDAFGVSKSPILHIHYA